MYWCFKLSVSLTETPFLGIVTSLTFHQCVHPPRNCRYHIGYGGQLCGHMWFTTLNFIFQPRYDWGLVIPCTPWSAPLCAILLELHYSYAGIWTDYPCQWLQLGGLWASSQWLVWISDKLLVCCRPFLCFSLTVLIKYGSHFDIVSWWWLS